jgi:hypothetical protein
MNNRIARHYGYGGGLATTVFIEGEELSERCNSPCSPSNLVYARSHADLAGRKPRPITEGLNLREDLITDDYWNWE